MASWVTTTKEGASPQRIYAFGLGANNHLRVTYWTGTQWESADQGLPSGTGIQSLPGTTSYFDGAQRIDVFCLGGNGHVHANYWNGSQWNWADLGKPSGTSPESTPEVITYSEAGLRRIIGFVMSQNNHLHAIYYNGTQWNWSDQGMPPATMVWSPAAVVTYFAAGQQHVDAFIVGQNNHIYRNNWNGTQWQWVDQGSPPGTTVTGLGIFKTPPDAVTYLDGGIRRIYAFVAGANGHLLVNYWNGTQWQWADQGTPPGATVAGSPSVITYAEGGKQRLFAFIPGSKGHLYVNYWNGNTWQWADQGAPAGAPLIGSVSAISYLDGGIRRIYAFSHDTVGHLIVNYWNGVQWQWSDLGLP
jgi:hypothetical protein